MKNYELTVVLAGKISPAKKKAIQASIEKLVKVFKGKIKKIDDWGEIDFAYELLKNDSGTFVHFSLELEAESVKEISAKLNLEEDILRYLVVKKEN